MTDYLLLEITNSPVSIRITGHTYSQLKASQFGKNCTSNNQIPRINRPTPK